MLVIPKSQQKWITPRHYSLKYNRNQEYLKMSGSNINQQKVAKHTDTEILFLDDVKLGVDKTNVLQMLGEPFFIFHDIHENKPHLVFNYGLKSGSNKLKVELHFIKNSFSFGTISYLASGLNFIELNTLFKEKYGIPSFNILRDIIVDPLGNFIDFHLKHNSLVIAVSQK